MHGSRWGKKAKRKGFEYLDKIFGGILTLNINIAKLILSNIENKMFTANQQAVYKRLG